MTTTIEFSVPSSWLKTLFVQPFTATPGPRVSMPTSPLGVLSLFFTSSLPQFLVLQTNQYALEWVGGEKFAHWSQMTVPELGIQRVHDLDMPSIYDYWKRRKFVLLTSWLSNIPWPILRLHRYLHFAETSPPPGDPGMISWGKYNQCWIDWGRYSDQCTVPPPSNVDEAVNRSRGDQHWSSTCLLNRSNTA